MKIHLDDPYWSRLVAAAYKYEPELWYVVDMVRDIPYFFVDCGANFGYWSILISGGQMGSHKGLAIEASRGTFAILQENQALNSTRFCSTNVAISDSSGHRVAIDSSLGHAGARIANNAHEGDSELVTTITLDDVIEQHLDEIPDYLVVKLDVEGEELNALKGASHLLNRDVLFIYEDHGSDADSRVTRYVLEELDLVVLFSAGNHIIRIRSAEEATEYKTRKSYGYNFVACKRQSRFHQTLLKIDPRYDGGAKDR